MSKQKINSMCEHDNVMLLAMSTLPYQPKVNTYQIMESKEKEMLYFKSFSQMEPHTKYVLHLLADKKERLDRIVILESEKARNERPDNWNGETATTIFSKRIRNYCGKEEQVEINVPDPLNNLVEASMTQQLYQDKLPQIITVNLENPVFFWKTVQEILGPDHSRPVDLYMDMQGGDRNAVSQMNAIVTLLERQNVIVKGRYANDFEAKRKTPLHTIREAGKEYRTYDLISAMDVFAQYGWGSKLEEYFRRRTKWSSKEQKLIKAINQASSAISKCNSDGFDCAVQKIKDLKSMFDESETVTEMDVVYQDIYENYKALFDPEKYRYVEQIRWCLDKNFLQQALTIFEAKMPYEFVCSGLIYYMTKDASEKEKDEFIIKCEQIYINLKRKSSQLCYKMKDLNHYLLKDYLKIYTKDGQLHYLDSDNFFHFGLGYSQKERILCLLYEYKALCDLRNQINHAAVGEHDPNGFFCYMHKKYPNDKNWTGSTGTNYEKKIRDYLDKWERLAKDVPEELKMNILDMS